MTSRILISVVLLLLALASIGDTFVFTLLVVVTIPSVVFVQVLIELLAQKISGKKESRRFYSIIPSLVVSLAILFKLSVWAQPYEIFELAMGSKMPSSVEHFTYQEDSWTDYSVRFHCTISPNDLEKILEKGKFTKEEGDDRLALSRSIDEIVINKRKIDPISEPVTYSYTIHNEDGMDGWCSLKTNPGHDRIYVIYSID
ncbi:hypothetical protein MLD52_19815 [Puniceicoccaceae bacterium K14]|nr:hypothetical protein [Puniceicoccaceae bacterium K14]